MLCRKGAGKHYIIPDWIWDLVTAVGSNVWFVGKGRERGREGKRLLRSKMQTWQRGGREARS